MVLVREQNNARSIRLRKLFVQVLSGEEKIETANNAKLFLEAITNDPDPASCLQKIMSSAWGFPALQAALRVDTSYSFLNGPLASLLIYLQAPELKGICGGAVLNLAVFKISDPPYAWNALIEAARAGHLKEDGHDGFSWLLHQLIISSPDERALSYTTAIPENYLHQLSDSPKLEVRNRAHRLLHLIETMSSEIQPEPNGPGGRHDNDFSDIKKISILPTADELSSKNPFLRSAVEMDKMLTDSPNIALHLDNQFRLLREDMLRDLREEVQAALSDSKKGRRKGRRIDYMSFADVRCDERHPWSMCLQCAEDIPEFKKKNISQRQKILKDHPSMFKHESVACLVVDDQVMAMATLIRDEDLLVQSPSVFCLQLSEAVSEKVLIKIKAAKNIGLIQLNTAVFAYEPVLNQLKNIREISLEDIILYREAGKKQLPPVSYKLSTEMSMFIKSLQADHSKDLQKVLRLPKSTILDKSQAESFLAGIGQLVSVLQGPPGTGKTFIGSLTAKAIYAHSKQTMLVVCYTHHALDDFLGELLDRGIPESDIVRLGSAKKASMRVKHLAISELLHSNRSMSRDQGLILDILRQNISTQASVLRDAFVEFREARSNKKDLLEYLEFQSSDSRLFEAFHVPEEEGGRVRVGKKGKAIDPFYLIDRWCTGKNAGTYDRVVGRRYPQIWQMSPPSRFELLDRWKEEILEETVKRVRELGTAYNASLGIVNSILLERELPLMRQKRIIACTTTAAAKYVKAIQSINPGVVIVEEAGEILESHVLTALGPDTKQLVLIGDHKQLRPKVHHDLSVEKGDGYDLNRSLFERLVLKGYPHQTLLTQHRMRPEISSLIRKLTYPDLVDDSSTMGRPDLRGFQDNIIFMNHNEPEDKIYSPPTENDHALNVSKQNTFEAKMTLKCVKYLGQQGYGTGNIVILTPYLAQLRLLFDELSEDNDPVLNDLDSYDLVKAGLMPSATADAKKPQIRISTIDNYQGEESDIVVASLTRSNSRGDIGWMSSPERLNVLLSRARDALIIIGNADTFLASHKGKEHWRTLINMLTEGHHIYNGFPVKCERHSNRVAVLKCPSDFDEKVPDGGCSEPCGRKLNCGIHNCPSRCHQLYDHSKMDCKSVIESRCTKNHIQRTFCHQNLSSTCLTCQREYDEQLKEMQEKLLRQEALDKLKIEHESKIAHIEKQIRQIREQNLDEHLKKEREDALGQKKADLDAAVRLAECRAAKVAAEKEAASKNADVSSDPAIGPKPETDPEAPVVHEDIPKSVSETEWERQKQVDGASNDAIDTLMSMTGLEEVKAKFLSIRSKIDTVARQGTDMQSERLGLVLLGNPGTGKTTVARLYGRFLETVGALPGSEFEETTGSRLANEGVNGATKRLDKIDKAGGGVFFIDEAYQLTDGNTQGGAAVCQFLLAEIENRRGKVVFILAGYNKPMEKFFESNEGFDSRMPYRLHFADYTDKELLTMLRSRVEKKYKGNAKLEDGFTGLYSRIAIKRLGRNRGKEGYGNARALENLWERIAERQSNRLQEERALATSPDDFFFSKEDLIGPEPTKAVQKSNAWKELQSLIGLETVKNAVKVLINRIQLNYQRELQEKPPIEVSLNRVFLGNPGTGKTSVGKLYASILADMGLLSKGEVVIKNPSDFIGSVLGESEKNTRGILKATEGKVLIVDEAYMLFASNNGGGNASSDPFRTAVIDTIVAEVQSTPGEDRCVLLLGYDDQMKEMLDGANPGLARRFPLSSAFHFDDFNDAELREILNLKLTKQGLDATEVAKTVAIEVLARRRDLLNFGNAGEVENLISHAKEQEQRRRMNESSTNGNGDVLFLPQDFDENFDRAKNSDVNCQKLFEDIVGCDNIIQQFKSYQEIAVKMKALNRDPRKNVPFNFIFKGPPGTGKTTTARKVGELYYNMGLLSTVEYEECSASDLVGQYVGQTGPKTIKALERGLGKVLFIDEAYRLCDSSFGNEAIGQLVDSLTKPQFLGKLVVILAGYDAEMNKLLSMNQGLSRRFPNEVRFSHMTPDQCFALLIQLLKKEQIKVLLSTPKSKDYQAILNLFEKIATLPGWGNGGDVVTLAQRIVATALQKSDSTSFVVSVTEEDMFVALHEMYRMKKDRCENISEFRDPSNSIPQALNQHFAPPVQTTSNTSMATETETTEQEDTEELQEATPIPRQGQRDLGVPDAIWAQLQADAQANDVAEKMIAEDLQKMERAAATLDAQKQAIELTFQKSDKADDSDDSEDEDDAEQKALKAKAEALNRAAQEAAEKARLARLEEERKRRIEAQAQQKLRDMGVCVAGFQWIKQSGGYRCAGGAHFVSNAQLGV